MQKLLKFFICLFLIFAPMKAFCALPDYVYSEIKNNAQDVVTGVVEKSDYLEYKEYTCYLILVIESVDKTWNNDKTGETQTLTYNCSQKGQEVSNGVVWYDLIQPGSKIKVFKNGSEIVNGGIEFIEKPNENIFNDNSIETDEGGDVSTLIIIIGVIIVITFAYYSKKEKSLGTNKKIIKSIKKKQ
jgi:hypothetical protein